MVGYSIIIEIFLCACLVLPRSTATGWISGTINYDGGLFALCALHFALALTSRRACIAPISSHFSQSIMSYTWSAPGTMLWFKASRYACSQQAAMITRTPLRSERSRIFALSPWDGRFALRGSLSRYSVDDPRFRIASICSTCFLDWHQGDPA
jgi:hypothetical protein